jgi:hypothetical protein
MTPDNSPEALAVQALNQLYENNDKGMKELAGTPDKDDAPWLNTTYDGFMTHEEMLEEARRREAEAAEEQIRHFSQLTRNERIEAAIEELGWVAVGGQDGEEWLGSMTFILRVLKSLRDEEP